MKKSYLFLSLCLFVDYPQTKKKKKPKQNKKNYTVLEFTNSSTV